MTHVQTNGERGSVTAPKSRVSRKPRGLPAHLGVFQFLVMAVAKRRKQVFADEIAQELAEDMSLPVDLAQVYVTAKRLVSLDYLTFTRVEDRQGYDRPVKSFSITDKGELAMRATADLLAIAMHAANNTTDKPPAVAEKKTHRGGHSDMEESHEKADAKSATKKARQRVRSVPGSHRASSR